MLPGEILSVAGLQMKFTKKLTPCSFCACGVKLCSRSRSGTLLLALQKALVTEVLGALSYIMRVKSALEE